MKCAFQFYKLGEYYNILSKVVPNGADEVLGENKTFLFDEIVLYEFDGKNNYVWKNLINYQIFLPHA